jgi:hypothetical protein
MAGRTLAGGLALTGDWNEGEDHWKVANDLNLLKLSIIAGRVVLDRVSATPGAPVEGDVHIFKADHPTQPNKIAAYDEGAWVYLTPLEGYRLFSIADGHDYLYTVAGGWAVTPTLYYNYGSFAAAAISAGEVLMDHIVTVPHTLADNFVGCQASVGSNPAALWTADIRKNGVSVGSLAISAAGVVTFDTTGADVAMAAGDLLSLIAPGAVDATIARLRFTFRGTIS